MESATWTFEVSWNSSQVQSQSALWEAPVGADPSAPGSLGAFFGTTAEYPELSLLGPDVVEMSVVPGTLEVGPPNASSRRRRVAFHVQIRNRLSGVTLGPSLHFPKGPPGISGPVLIPYEAVATLKVGGVSGGGNVVVVEMPSEGDVVPSDSIWKGAHYSLFSGRNCEAGSHDCFPFQALREEGTGRTLIGPLNRTQEVRVGYDADLTVHQFRIRLTLVAGLSG